MKVEEVVVDSLVVVMEFIMEEIQVYEGVFFVVDGLGICYVLILNILVNVIDIMYILDVIYLDVEGKGKDKIFIFKGKLVKVEKIVKDKKKMVIKLNLSDGSEFVYFVIVNDIILILVDDSLEVLESDLNYNIICVK